MKITDFAELQQFYTGANNKRKWIIKKPKLLKKYLEDCDFKPALLKQRLNVSYATVKRLLWLSGLWDQVKIKKQCTYKSGRKRTAIVDQFGYKFADSKYDYINDRGEIIRRFEHHVNAEIFANRKLSDREVVHHVDLDKQNNSKENLYICKDNREHRTLHGQLETLAGELVRKGIIKFCPKKGYYV